MRTLLTLLLALPLCALPALAQTPPPSAAAPADTAARPKVALVLSGSLAPLDLFPEAIRGLLPWTPFPYLIDVPVQALLGRLSGPDLLRALLVQAAWLLLFVLASRALWRSGLRRYGAVGA